MLEPFDKSKNAYILEFKVYNPRTEDSLEDTVSKALLQIDEKIMMLNWLLMDLGKNRFVILDLHLKGNMF